MNYINQIELIRTYSGAIRKFVNVKTKTYKLSSIMHYNDIKYNYAEEM